MAKPTIVFVPGSFAVAFVYQDLVDRLRAKGFPSLEIVLPSTQKRAGLEPATMQEDAKRIRAVAKALISQAKEVVVVCHSYSGIPTAEALAGVPVKRIIYMTAIAPKVGESFLDALSGPMSQVTINNAVNGYLHSDPCQLAGGIGNDFKSWEYAYECAQKLVHHSAISFTTALTQAGYGKFPVSYIFTEKDLVVSPDKQQLSMR